MATLLISNSNIRPSNFPMIDQLFDLDEVLTLAEESTQLSHDDDDDDDDDDDQIIEVEESAAAQNISRVNYMPPTDNQTMSSRTVLGVEYSCMVCMESFHYSGGGEQIPCGHVYHANCIAAWLSVCDSCPLCRRRISAVEQFSCAGKQH